LSGSLSDAGLVPSDVTDVLLTHLHFDHVGGATEYKGDLVVPAFPHAKYYVQREQFEWAMNPSEKDRASFMLENYQPLVDAGCLQLLEGAGELFPGISVHPFYGHTSAMQMVTISDGNTTLAFPADLMPTHAHVPVPYVMGYDNYPITTISEKKSILPQMAEEQWIVVYEHDALMEASRIVRTEKGFRAGEACTI
jgi:glyoxylase-like metal-dependent hydrolase (beta-lactamase superfamily II)